MNIADGTVRMVAESEQVIVSALIRSVLEAMRGLVSDHSEEWGRATGEFSTFAVRYEGR